MQFNEPQKCTIINTTKPLNTGAATNINQSINQSINKSINQSVCQQGSHLFLKMKFKTFPRLSRTAILIFKDFRPCNYYINAF